MKLERMASHRSQPCSSAELVVFVDQLPRAAKSETKTVLSGYAVNITHHESEQWLFFQALEPAYVAGRACRMASGVRGWGIFSAALEHRWDEGLQRDVSTLHVDESRSHRDHTTEGPILARWAKKVSSTSSHWPMR